MGSSTRIPTSRDNVKFRHKWTVVRKMKRKKWGNLSDEQREKGSGKENLKFKSICEFMKKGEADKSKSV